MSRCNFDIKVDCEGEERQQKYQGIRFVFETKKAKIQKHEKEIADNCMKDQSPFVCFQFPVMDFQNIDCSVLNQEILEQKSIVKNNKFYIFGNFHSADHNKFIRNFGKTFKKLNELDNNCEVELKFYEDQQNLQSWKHFRLKGQLNIDKDFVSLCQKLLKDVSPGFIDSPLLIGLQILEELDIQLNLKNQDILGKYLRTLISQLIDIQKAKGESFLQLLSSLNNELTMYLTVSKLFYVEIRGLAKTFAHLFKII